MAKRRLTREQKREETRVLGILARADANRRGPNGEHVPELATCGTCGRTWDDGRISELTPAPGARCPFEGAHAPEPEPSKFTRAGRVIAIDGVAAVYVQIVTDPKTSERGIQPVQADALTDWIVRALNAARVHIEDDITRDYLRRAR